MIQTTYEEVVINMFINSHSIYLKSKETVLECFRLVNSIPFDVSVGVNILFDKNKSKKADNNVQAF